MRQTLGGAAKIGIANAGTDVYVTGKTADVDWYSVERDGKPFGFVFAKLVRPRMASWFDGKWCTKSKSGAIETSLIERKGIDRYVATNKRGETSGRIEFRNQQLVTLLRWNGKSLARTYRLETPDRLKLASATLDGESVEFLPLTFYRCD